MSLTLILGGTRSGKSLRAEQLACASGAPVSYLATADPDSPGMAERITRHVARRPPEWRTVQAGDDPSAEVRTGVVTLLDGLGVWIAGVLHRHGSAAGEELVEAELERLVGAADTAEVIVVAEQAGEGLLPLDALSRAWLDLLGESTQRLAQGAAEVELVVAGRPLRLPPRPSFRPPEASGPSAALHALRRHGDQLIRPGDRDHAVNVLQPQPPPWLRRDLEAALASAAARYPDERPACAALAGHHGRSPAEVVPANGAAEALWLLGPALRPRLAACIHPAFTEAEAGLRAHGIPVARVLRDPDEAFRLNPQAVPEEADLVVVGNPVSPSGTLDPAQALLALRRPGRILAVDEAFISMIPGEPGSLAAEPLADVIVIRSLTKVLSVPGLRAGYALAPPALADALRALRPPWAANALALAALESAAAHPAELALMAEQAAAAREDLAERLQAIPGLRTWPSHTNFLLVEVPDGEAALQALRRRHIAVRPAASFPGLGPHHLRITARDPAANADLAAVLREALTA